MEHGSSPGSLSVSSAVTISSQASAVAGTVATAHSPPNPSRLSSHVAAGEPLTRLIPNPLTSLSPLGGQPAALRVPHTTDLPQGSAPDNNPQRSVTGVFGSRAALCEPAATPPKGLTLMLGMVVWDVRSRASTRER